MPDIAGNSLGTATSLSLTSNTQTFPDIVTATASDYYRFILSYRSSVNLSLTGLSADANVALLTASGTALSVNGVLQTSNNTGNLAESINTTLDAGTYYVRVATGSSTVTANYSLNVSANNDLKTDILWRNYSTGENIVWLMNGTTRSSFVYTTPVNDPNWAISGAGDFNQDGQSDIVWRNATTGENIIWLMNGTTRNSFVYTTPVNDPNWAISGVGDFNQDGQSDLVWRNATTGENIIWLMNGTTRNSFVYTAPVNDPNWKISGVGDFNQDGQSDLVWRNATTGENIIWLMNGTTRNSVVYLPSVNDSNWKISGTGDFNQDGKADLLWRNGSTGENIIWLMNGTTRSSVVYTTPVNDSNWRSLSPFIRAVEPAPISVAGNTLANAFGLGSNLTGSGTYRNTVSSLNSDYYQLNLGTSSAVNLTLTGLTANLDVQIVNSSNQVLQSSTLANTSSETINSTLAAGTYYVRVYPANGGSSAYALNLSIDNLPVLVSNAGLTLDEAAGATIGSSLLQVTDNDNLTAALTYTLGNLPGHGALSLNGAVLGVGSTFTQADIGSAKLRYLHDGSETLTDSFSFAVSDSAGGAIVGNTFSITVNPVNDAPILTVPGGQTVDQNANSLISGISVADADGGTGNETMTIAAANGLVALGLTTGLTFAQGNGSPAASLTVSGTLSALNNALNSLIYRSTGSFLGTDTINLTINDNGNTGKGGALTASKTIAIAVNAVNKAPTITVPASQSVNEDTSLSLSGISISDVDAGGGNETVSLSAVNGVLSLGATAGLTFSTGTGSKDRNVTFSGTLALINAALQSLTYQGNKDFNGSDVITISVNDNGNTGNGVALSDTRSVQVTVAPVNDAPVVVIPTAQSVNENASLQLTGISINDVDAGSGAVTVSLAVANGKLSLGSITGLSFTSGNGSASTSLIFSGTLAAVNSALTTLVYQGNANFSGTDALSINVNDNGNTGSGIALSDSKTLAIAVLGVNQAPVIAVPLAPSTTANTNLTITGVSISDPDAAGGNETVTIAASNGFLLLSSFTGLTFSQGAGNQPSTRLTFRGTLAAINTAIGNLVYRSYPGFTGFEAIVISVNDGGNTGIGTALSDTKTLFVNVGGAVNAPPTANPDSYSTTRNTALTITGQGVLTNDTDPENNALTANLLTTPTNGTVVFNSNGTFTYTPNANYVGSDSFTYRASDGIGNSNAATVNLTVTAPVNQAPTAVADNFFLSRNTTFTTGNVLTNDSDPDNNVPLTAQLVAAPTQGSLTLNSNGTFTYIPTTNFTGADSFTYVAKDALGAASTTATVSLTVTAPANQAPIATADAYSLTQNTTLTTGNVLSNDSDPDNNVPLTAQLVAAPTHGSLTLNSNGSFTYVPTANYTGTDSFTYLAKDALGASSGTATVSLTVNAANQAPVATADAYSLSQNTTFTTGNVLTNDSDPDNNVPLTAQLVAGPTQGSLTLNSNGTFTYIPTTNFAGTDRFTYLAKDALGASSGTATVSLTVVNQVPTAVADAYSLSQNTTFTTGNVLSNDSDPDNNVPLTAQIVATPTHATSFTLNSNGTFTYIPTANYTGTDSFTYLAKDALGASSGTATVSLTVNAANQSPVATADTYSLSQNTTFTTGNVLTNDSDPDNNVPLTAQLVAGPTQGSLTLNSNGTFTYIPTTNFAGTDRFTYIAKDALGASSGTATVSLTVNAANQAPVATADTYSLTQNSTFTTGNVLSNDSDPDNNTPLTAQLVAAPTHGSLTLNSNGTFTYIPTANYTGTDSFTYLAKDALGASSGTATVSLTVNAANQAPVATADTYSLTQNSTFTTGNVLSNDSDPDNNTPLTAQLVAAPTHGSLTLNSNGTFTYIPTANYTGTDSFTYLAKDALGASSGTATVSLTVNAANQSPVATADAYSLSQNTTFTTGNVLTNDSDPDNNVPLTAQLVAGPTQGSLTLNSNGTFTYIPTTNFAGTDRFTYLAKDALGASSGTATVSLTVVNQVPTAVADAYSLSQNTTFTTGNVLTNDSDPDNNVPLTAQLVAGPTQGSLTLNSNGTFTYIPTTNFAGTDRFTYIAKDALGATSGTATVSLTVVNQVPTAVADAYSLSQNTTFTTGNVLTNDSDPDNNVPLTAQLVAGPTQGSLTLNSNGTFTYIPTTNFAGTDRFTYIAKDALGATSGTATVSLTVVNQVPTAVADAYSLSQNTTFTTGNVLTNDSDPDNNTPLTAQLVTGPTQGSLTLNSNGTFTYIPTTNFAGTDRFTYLAKDALGASSGTATVSLTVVNQVPTAVADAYTLLQNTTLTSGNVLSNDSDPDNNVPLTAQLVAGPTHGSLTLNSNGTFTYIPTANYTGTDSFTYLAKDALGASSGTATVSLSVAATNQSPTAVADAYSLSQNTTFTTGNVLTNDSDPDNNTPLTAQLVAGPTQGSLTLNSNGTFTYIPTTNFAGTDRFTYIAKDALGGTSGTATVSLTVVNQVPTAVADAYTLSQNTTFTTGNVLTNDSDPDNNTPLTAQLVAGPTQGSLTLNSNGTFTYIPTANFVGTDSFTYLAKDALGASSGTATVSLSVKTVNLSPNAVNDAFRAVTSTPLTISATNGVLKNDTDADSPTLTALLVSAPANGSVTLNSNGSFVYTPTANFSGTDTFTYKANDGNSDSNLATVTLTVFSNTAPTANADTYTVAAGVPLTIDQLTGVLSNDTDAEGDALTASLVTTTSSGSLTFNSDGTFVYTPNASVTNGTDTFVYRVSDGFSNSSPATVTLNIGSNVAPIAQNDTYSAFAGGTLSIDQFSGVLTNDTDTQPLSAILVSGPSQGTLSLNSNGSFTYAPNASFTSGTDTFVYKASDGALTASATVTLSVSTATVPIAQNDTYQVVAGTALSVAQTAGVLNNDSGTNGATLTAQLVTAPSQGTVTLNADGSFTYTPSTGVTSGTDTFVYRATNGGLNSSPATVTLSIFSNARPVATNDSYSVVTNNPLTIAPKGVLANDTDSDVGQTLKAVLAGQPNHGSLTLRADGSFVYTPDQGYLGADTFTYRVNDGFQDSTSLGTVSLSIVVNAAPIANADTYSVNQNNVLIKDAASGVLQNDTDIDPLTASVVNAPTKGSLALSSDGSFTYTPNASVTNTTDTFVYKASDGSLSANATVTVSIKGTSSPPTAVNDTGYTVNANGALTVAAAAGVLTNDTDPDGDRLKAVTGTAPSHGTVTLNSDGSFVYTPTAGYLGNDSFTYFANDGVANSLNPATVSITVGGANQPPTIAVPGNQVVFRNTDLVIQSGLSIGDPDAGTNAVAVTLTADSGNLTLSTTNNLTVTGNGSQTVTLTGTIAAINTALTNLVYHPVDAGFTGTDQIGIAVNDNGNTGSGGAQTSNATISVNVTTGPTLVKDINPTQNATASGTNSSSPANLTSTTSGNLYFTANDGVSGVELWRSDGTDAGTSIVADLNTTPDSSGSSNPSNLTVIGTTLYFTADNSIRGTELWKADLTGATSPTIVKDIRSGSAGSNPRNLVNFNGTLYFEANDGSGLVLWKTDGTAANTVKVETTAGYSQPGLLAAASNTLYFTAGNGTQLWRVDATGTQTTLLQDIGTGAGITNLVTIGNALFFTASNSSNGVELWRSDGTAAGTTRISDINPGVGDASPSSLVNFNGTLYFVAKNGSNVYGLWQSTAAGAVSLVGALPSAGQVPTSLTVVGSKLFFVVDAGTSSAPDLQLWQSNGTTASLVKAINASGNDAVASLTNVNGSLFFTANDGSTRIWKSDGTDAGTVSVSANFTGVTPHNFTAVGNRLFFTAETTKSILVVPDPNNPTVFTQINGTTGEELFVL